MKSALQVMNSAAASLTGFASNVTGASFTLTTTETSDGLGHLVTVLNDTANDHSGKTIALVGTDENGNVQTETIAGPGVSATVTSTKYFKTLVSPILPSATIGADTFDIGWALGSRGAWFQPDLNNGGEFNVGIGCAVVSGSPNYGVVVSYDRTAWFAHATIAGKTASFGGQQTTPVVAMAVQFTAAGAVTTTFIQPNGRG